MATTSKAKIFLCDERGCNETDWYRSYHTFNSGNYFNQHKQPFKNLSTLSENTLAAGQCLQTEIELNSIVILLPVVGTIGFKNNTDNEIHVNVGQLLACHCSNGDVIQVSNPYSEALVNFIQLHIETDILKTGDQIQLSSFVLETNKNSLVPVLMNQDKAITDSKELPIVSIGKFAGREEAVYSLHQKQNSLFVFVIQGVFEMQGRLLHAKDGLAIWDEAEDVELEALSNDAIVLLVELYSQ